MFMWRKLRFPVLRKRDVMQKMLPPFSRGECCVA
jgi:hypothetical protein